MIILYKNGKVIGEGELFDSLNITDSIIKKLYDDFKQLKIIELLGKEKTEKKVNYVDDELEEVKKDISSFNLYCKEKNQFFAFSERENKPKHQDKKALSYEVLELLQKNKTKIEKESLEYDKFLSRYYSSLQSKVLSALTDKNFGVIKTKKTIDKRFTEFIMALTTILDAKNAEKRIRETIKETFINGIEKAEEETGVQVGFQDQFNPRIDGLTDEQINGYVMPNGEKWFGIQGANDKLKREINQSIADGLANGESTSDLKSRVKTVFEDAKTWEATRIARTESTRLANIGANTAYIQSGLSGHKEWLAAIDERTSPLCRRLNGQKVGLTDAFTDPDTGKKFHHPPSHSNCFVGNTKIITNNEDKNIKDIKVGDEVLTHKNRFQKVTETMKRETDTLFEIEIGSGLRKKILKVTGEHPIMTQRGWIKVKDLNVNDYVLTK